MVRLLTISLLSIIAMVLGAQMLAGDTGSESPTVEVSADAMAAKAHNPQDSARNAAFYATDRTVIRRDSSGQFHVTAQVNGQDLRFLVDTGADVIALSVDAAQMLGLGINPNEFTEITQTASGPGMGERVVLDRLDVGGREFTDVPAVVVEGLEVNLLGQSVLRRFGKVELAGDRMVIHRE